jgi:CMP-N-acetylneuraminic acid synthetase
MGRPDLKILAIIPARGGSKSIPRKNIKDFLGKPLIAWAIEAALASRALDKVVVSTDDDEIAAVAKKFGAEIPFKRPAELATDTAPTMPVLRHAVQWLKDNENYNPDAVMLLEPISPTRQAVHIKEAIELFRNSGVDSVVSVTPAPAQYNPHWLFQIGSDGQAELFTGEPVKDIIPRRQLLPAVYAKNGALYLFRTDCLFRNPPSLFGDKVKLYIMGPEYNIDIDEPEDWPEAEARVRKLLNQKKHIV